MQKNVNAKTRAVIHFLGHKSSWSFNFSKVKPEVIHNCKKKREGEVKAVVILDIFLNGVWELMILGRK